MTTNMYIAGRRVLASGNFLARTEEMVLLEFQVGTLAARLQFVFSDVRLQDQVASWEQVNGVFTVRLFGWDNPSGSCTAEPLRFAESNGKGIYFALASWRIGLLNAGQFSIVMDP